MNILTIALIIAAAWVFLYFFALYYFNGFSTKKGEPTLLRGQIPFFGVMLDIGFKGLYQFVVDASKKYGNIFTVFLLGKRIHVISDYFAYSQIQRKPHVFSFNPVIQDFGKLLKHSDDAELEDVRDEAVDPVKKYLMGKELEILSKVYGRLVVEKLEDEFKKGSVNGSMVVDLKAFVRKVLYYASGKSLCGVDFDTDSTETDFFTFDDNLKILVLGIPEIFTKSIFEARGRVLKELEKCDLKNNSCAFIQNGVENKTKEKAAVFSFSMLGASQTNSINGGFWTFYNVMKQPELRKQIMSEISEQFSIEEYEKSIDSMKTLHGAYLETMRFHNLGVSIREALEDTKLEVDSKSFKIRKGDRIYMLPVAYKDPEVFTEPEKFDASRYSGKQSDKMIKSTIPFGGGVHMCPGRFFAINEIKLFTILMLKHFDCELAEDKNLENNMSNVSYLAPIGDIKIKLSNFKK
eukprot:gene12128-5619_t